MYEDCQGVNLPPPSFCHERRECAFATGNGKIYISKGALNFRAKLGVNTRRGCKGGRDCVVGVRAAAIHWLPSDGVTKQSVE